jgi:UDP-N-acetylmuramoyl-L-alanyl-D-glutamate--2,6-diaminopimelate ligase
VVVLPDVQALFAAMVEQGVDAVAMEVSSHALSLGRVAGTRFAVGAFTNLSQDHLDFHPDMESYFQAKAMLFDGRSAAGVVDIDDAYGRRLARMHPELVTVSSTGDPDADWSVVDTAADAGLPTFPGGARQRFVVRRPSGDLLPVDLSLPGRFNVANAVLALACVDAVGRDVGPAAAALRDVVVPGRMERVDAGQDFLVVVDYAHKPAALTAVLTAIAADTAGRLIVVVGAGGDRDAGKRPVMGQVAAELADLLIVTDDNPRSEDPAAIRAAVLRGAGATQRRLRPGSAEIREIGDRHEAIRAAIAAAAPGDAVLIAGKGHEQGQDVGGVIHPFSDRAEVTAALAGRPGAADAPGFLTTTATS